MTSHPGAMTSVTSPCPRDLCASMVPEGKRPIDRHSSCTGLQ